MELSQESCPNFCSDLTFGLDNPAFSDRILKLLIFDETSDQSTGDCKLNYRLSIQKQRKDLVIPESSREHRVKSLSVCSLILAAKSQFFCKLFTNGMKASDQQEVALHIHSSEAAAVMDVIKFMYNKKLLSANTPNALAEVILAADKYDVPLCVNYCCTLLLSFPMTSELALFYIDLSSLIPGDSTRPLFNAAENFLPDILKDIRKYRQDIINLSLDAIKLILARDDLKVNSEDEVYDLLMEWSKHHFSDSDERFRVLKDVMFDVIRLQYMTPQKLENIVDDFCGSNNNLALGGLPSMIKAILVNSKPSLPKHRRSYNLVPVVVVSFEVPYQQYVIYLDLKREECKRMEMEILKSQTFTLDENIFYLSLIRLKNVTKRNTFGIYLCLEKSTKKPVQVNLEFNVRERLSPGTFVRTGKSTSHTFIGGKKMGIGSGDLFDAPWDAVMGEDSHFFINGTIYLRVDVTLNYTSRTS